MQRAAGRRGRPGRAAEHRRAASATTTSTITAVGTRRARRLQAMREQHVRLRGARPAPARHDRLRAARAQIQHDAALRDVPVVVFTGRELSQAEEDASCARWRKSIVVKGVQSPERLLDETALFLHRVVDRPAAEPSSGCSRRCTTGDEPLVGRKVLVVDDDVRNIFALTSVLERRGMEVHQRQQRPGGDRARWRRPTDLALVLMDIMMPEMDGYETMRRIRGNTRVPAAADHRADGQGHEGRPREVPGGRRLRLPGQAGQHRAAAVPGCECGCTAEPTESS